MVVSKIRGGLKLEKKVSQRIGMCVVEFGNSPTRIWIPTRLHARKSNRLD